MFSAQKSALTRNLIFSVGFAYKQETDNKETSVLFVENMK